MPSLLRVLYASALVPLSVLGQINSNAQCQPEYSWMVNRAGFSPCLLAANVNALCNYGTWQIPSLSSSDNNGYGRPSPKNKTASYCTCSWASYNLISACIACQGFPERITNWGDYSLECTDLKSETFWPKEIFRPETARLPFWSIRNPTEWMDQKFSTSQAREIARKSDDDVGNEKQKSTPVGAIVGGVIGGLVVVAAFIALAIFMIRKQKKLIALQAALAERRPPHSRKFSDMSTSSATHAPSFISSVAVPAVGHLPQAYTHTLHTQGSTSSLGLFSVNRDSAYTQSPSPPPRAPSAVTPFTLVPTGINPDQKTRLRVEPLRASTPPPNTLQMNTAIETSSKRKPRYNPPAYAESRPDTSGQPSRHRLGAGQGSVESIQSALSNSNSGHIRHGQNPSNSGSSTHRTVMTVMTPTTHTRSQDRPSRDHKRHPTQDSSEDWHQSRLA